MIRIHAMTRPALSIAAAMLAGSPGTALAGQPGTDWMPMDQVARKLGEAGYADLRSLKADDGRWEAKAVKDGKPVSLGIDPHSGVVTEDVKVEKKTRRKDEDGDDD